MRGSVPKLKKSNDGEGGLYGDQGTLWPHSTSSELAEELRQLKAEMEREGRQHHGRNPLPTNPTTYRRMRLILHKWRLALFNSSLWQTNYLASQG